MPAPVKVLFVCGQSNRRSLTAEAIFKTDRRVEVRAAGLADNSKHRLCEEDVRWADLILAMERKHAKRIKAAFPQIENLAPVESLDVEDRHIFMHPKLIEELHAALDAALEEYHETQEAG